MSNIPDIELQSEETIRDFQFRKIKDVLHYVRQNSPFYKKLLDGMANGISDWQSFEKLPTTAKDDLQKENWNFLCVDKGKIAEYTTTSGTLGKPVIIGLTENDVQRLAYNECISFQCADGDRSDLYQLMLTLDRQFMAGIAYYEGIRKLGAGLIRVGPGLPSLQWETIERLRPNALVAVPSFIVKLIEYAESKGIDLNRSSVGKIICIGEPIRTEQLEPNVLAKRILSGWNVRLFGTYASTEMQTAFTECHAGRGGHLHPELIYIEILNDHGSRVEHGQPGEVTITTLGVEGMPLVRYRTGDIATLIPEPCTCGRKTIRIGPVLGRKQQMIKLKGTSLYPPAIFEILQQVNDIRDFVVEVYKGALETDELRLHIHADDALVGQVDKKLRAAFQSTLRVVPEISFVSASQLEAIQAGGRKVKKFIDKR